ncbi:hypothetical protein RSOLAG1IB_11119 [Rhizoctonia solani AG-1 IB]|uniref:Zn(2)-C6 fungal-type domain-containing protein n=1 Tax=Thanatephorus cucumeris (strain AG1-IB / isolate 7/3/14) TaxID=1108050 RepID=A0A0B7F5F9_THACB|nr:hypothetical protein RSOLAG1IB_11119 [Rhizoctonia solani AG-1 IB]
MSRSILKRSTGGCITCKKRKKKCDERKPRCRRCEQGDFHCLGYQKPDNEATLVVSSTAAQSNSLCWAPAVPAVQFRRSPSLHLLDDLTCLTEHKYHQAGQPSSHRHVLFQEVGNCLSSIPKDILLDAVVIEDATSLIVSQCECFFS